jgi:2-dehydro-3-deoxyphosphogluconate aldolase / (4S)-4-hydroxy-2-oxoglutarate aldolase
MSPQAWLAWVAQQRIIAVIRDANPDLALKMAHTVAQAGIQCLEITWTCAHAPDLIGQLRHELPDCSIGTGTIVTPDQMEHAIAAQAGFIFSPHTNPSLIQRAIAADVPVIPGALTPTEILTAWQAGATAVKLFPISSCGGCHYLEGLRPVFPEIPFIPTGGVTAENASGFLAAGAIAVGLAGDLFPRAALQAQNWDEITRRAIALKQRLSMNVEC